MEEEKNKIKNDESIIAEERKKMLEKIEEKEKEMKKVMGGVWSGLECRFSMKD